MSSAHAYIEVAATRLLIGSTSDKDLKRLHDALELCVTNSTVTDNVRGHSCFQDLKRLPFRRALMTILAVAGRRSVANEDEPDVTSDERRQYHEIRISTEQLLGGSLTLARSQASGQWLSISRTLVRMDTLQVYSQIVARQTVDVASSEGDPECEGDLLISCGGAVDILQSLVPLTPVSSSATPQSAYADEFYAALVDSNLMEHLAKACLQLTLHHSHRQVALGAAAVIGGLLYVSDSLCTALCEEGAPEPWLARLRTVLSGRCLQHLMSSQLVSTLCAVDGGPSHGLPAALLYGLPVLAHKQHPLPDVRNATRRKVVSRFPFTPLGALGRQLPSRLRPAAVLQLQLRAARMALGSMRPAQGEQRFVFPETEAQGVACRMLLAAGHIVNGALASPEDAAEHVAWWHMMVRFLDTAAGGEGGMKHCLRLVMSSTVKLEAGPFSEVAPMALSAALSAGILPCLERALRGARVPPSAPQWSEPPATTAVWMWLGGPASWSYLWAYMAYGDPRQAASLVATLGKLLRRLTGWVLEETPWSRSVLVLERITKALANVPMRELQRLLRSVSEGYGESMLTTGPSRQALALLSYALVCWLPPLAELALAGGPSSPHSRTVAAPATAADPGLRGGALAAFLFVLPILLPGGIPGPQQAVSRHGTRSSVPPAACTEPEQDSGGVRGADGCAATTQAEQERGAQGSSPAAAAAAASPPPDGGGWRPWLLREARAMEVVCAALAGLEEVEEVADDPDGACCDVALCCVSAFQDEARAAVTAELTAPAAAGRASERGAGGSGGERGGESPALGVGIVDKLRSVQKRFRGSKAYGWVAHEVGALLEEPVTPGDKSCQRPNGGCQPQFKGCGDGMLGNFERLSCAVNRLLPPPEQLPALLPLPPACANPRCASLAGDSEAGVRLRACQRCGAARYCCRECQVAHWRAGHREACGRQQRAG